MDGLLRLCETLLRIAMKLVLIFFAFFATFIAAITRRR